MKRIIWGCFVLLAIAAGQARAGDLDSLKQACGNHRPSGRPGEHWLETCIIDFFTLEPVHPAANSIAPITGTGFGLGLDRIFRRDNVEYLPVGRALVSTDGSILFKGSLSIGFPDFLHPNAGTAAGDDDYQNWTLRGNTQAMNGRDIDAKPALLLHAERMDLMHQHFYGVGDSTTQSQLAIYRMRQTSGGAGFTVPLAKVLFAGISADYIETDIKGASATGRPSITSVYTESTAAGLTHQPGIFRVQPSARLVWKPVLLDFIELRSSYGFYHATGNTGYSFRQFAGSLSARYKIRFSREHTGSHYSAFKNAICTPLPAKECSAGSISARLFAVTSNTSGANTVPFYLQPTLGGTNLQGEDTMRGFRDYRFRAPNVVGMQTEFDHHIWGPIGVLGFYDVGRVATRTSDLGFSGFHHAIGTGFYVSAANIIVFRVSVGFGTGEGVRPNPKAGGALF